MGWRALSALLTMFARRRMLLNYKSVLNSGPFKECADDKRYWGYQDESHDRHLGLGNEPKGDPNMALYRS